MAYTMRFDFGTGVPAPSAELGLWPDHEYVRGIFERVPSLRKLEVFESDTHELVGTYLRGSITVNFYRKGE